MKLKSILALLCFVITSVSTGAQEKENSLLYLNQKPPTLEPEIFASGIISKASESEFGSIFSKDGTEFFYGVDIGGRTEIRYTRLEKSSWTSPKTIISDPKYGFNDPFLSPDEYRLYYISDMPNDKGSETNHDIWYSNKRPYGWSKPINAGNYINSNRNEYYMSFTNSGAMYFSSNIAAHATNNNDFDIYKSEWVKGAFQKPKKVETSINTKSYEADVFIAPDETYMIFCARRKDGLGRGDLYISFKNKEGDWTISKNMGAPINTKGHELCPFVTKDGKYFFYTSNQDIYWVDATILEKYR